MLLRSDTLAELIEPALYALRQPRGELVVPLLAQARAADLRARELLRLSGPLHQPSFELGVASTFTQLLSAAAQRSALNDAIQGAKDVQQGVEALHQLALISRLTTETTQRELADRIGADRGNFNRRIHKLESLGLVESQRRGQALVYSITALGIDVLSELRPGWRAIHPSTLAPVASEREARDIATGLVTALRQSIDGAFEREMIESLVEVLPASPRLVSVKPFTQIAFGEGRSVDRRPRLEPEYAFN